jgi:ABC-type microcin C transport system permease subunit YejB
MKVAFPHSLAEMMHANEADKKAKAAQIQNREDDIAKKMAKLDQWVTELHAKKSKKEAEAKAAKDRKDRLVEEVRRHFGFKLDARDERFKEMLEQKEREDRKKQKEAKRQVKEAKMIEKLSARTAANEQGGEPPKTADEK